MDRKRGLLAFLLFVLSVAFIAFVIIMQHNFTNPEFANAQSQSVEEDSEASDNSREEDEEQSEDDSVNDEDEVKIKYVAASLLNVRSEPNTDESYIVATLRLNDEVMVETIDESDEWVKISTDEFTGYVNDKYLEER